jgi:Transglutaminase-like superfamily
MGIFSTESAGLISSVPLLGGDTGTEQTISLLRSLVDDAWKDPFVNRTAIEIVRNAGVQPYDSWGQIRAIYNWVKGNFYFVNDPVMKEALRPTHELLQLLAGDCDDINANVLPSLLGTIGYETRLVTIAADPNAPDSFSHVYAEVFQDGNWYPLDAARPGAVFGVAPPHFFRRAWWSLTDGSHGDYSADGTMSGYLPVGVRGLGSIVSDLQLAFQGTSAALRSVSGQTVQSPIGPAIGPGGAQSVSASAPVGFSLSSGEGELLALAAIGLELWLLMEN